MTMQYRLTTEQTREWRSNQGMLTCEGEDGASEVVRAATKEEIKASFDYAKWVQTLPPERRAKAPPFSVKVDGKSCVITSIREILKAEVLAKHNADVILRANNGRTICVLRANPEKMAQVVEAQRSHSVAPHPDLCQCAAWPEREPGKHHYICYWNDKCPIEHQSQQKVVGRVATAQGNVEHEKLRPRTEEPVKPEVLSPPEPLDCDCANWPKPEGCRQDSHHPVCKWKDRWEEKQRGSRSWFVKDPKSGRVLRRATEAEVLRSEAALEETGAPLIEIDGKEYVVDTDEKEIDSQDKPAPEPEPLPPVEEPTNASA